MGMCDDAYREMLVRLTGKNSCSLMDIGELERVVSEMKTKGFTPTSKNYGHRPSRRQSADPMMRKIEALLADGGLHWNYAHAMAKRMFKVDRVEWLSDGNMHKLIAALQIAANRKKGES
ncbi:gp16 family protein [Neisseria animaloris]|uniref:gp16 family protein n=1 Tax=Neisseria animaloris TaxID=326522 RepID=UPI000D2F4D49|nr:regulatory protein GemA [Neisseria animaloris]